jgi:hypothetical protein
MKNWNRLMITSLLMAVTCHGQSIFRETVITKAAVPQIVLQAFEAAYPTARPRGYAQVESDGTVYYKIEVRDGAGHRYFSYDQRGGLAKTEEVIAATELPANAQQAVQEKYPSSEITYAEKIVQGDKIGYRANAKKSDKLFTVEFDSEGKVTSAREVKVTMVFRRMPE